MQHASGVPTYRYCLNGVVRSSSRSFLKFSLSLASPSESSSFAFDFFFGLRLRFFALRALSSSSPRSCRPAGQRVPRRTQLAGKQLTFRSGSIVGSAGITGGWTSGSSEPRSIRAICHTRASRI
jgi:hypothetical protein